MIWPVTVLATIAVLYVAHVFLKVDRQAAVCGLGLVVLALGMEWLNGWLGQFWISQQSALPVGVGGSVEKLILYLVGGTWACVALARVSVRADARYSGRWAAVASVALLMTAGEGVFNFTDAFRWVRPWSVFGAFVYYSVGAGLLFLAYDALSKTRIDPEPSPEARLIGEEIEVDTIVAVGAHREG